MENDNPGAAPETAERVGRIFKLFVFLEEGILSTSHEYVPVIGAKQWEIGVFVDPDRFLTDDAFTLKIMTEIVHAFRKRLEE